jgi:hypothetical protein
MQSFRKRFAGEEEGVLNWINSYIERTGGRYDDIEVLEHFGIGFSSSSWGKFIREICEKFNFTFVERDRNPIADYHRSPDVLLFNELAGRVSLIEAIARLRGKLKKKEEHIKELEQRLIENAEREALSDPDRIKVLI